MPPHRDSLHGGEPASGHQNGGASPLPLPKQNPKLLSLLLKAIIMTLITTLFFLFLGLPPSSSSTSASPVASSTAAARSTSRLPPAGRCPRATSRGSPNSCTRRGGLRVRANTIKALPIARSVWRSSVKASGAGSWTGAVTYSTRAAWTLGSSRLLLAQFAGRRSEPRWGLRGPGSTDEIASSFGLSVERRPS
ncbi:RING-type domain-containing protein, partial [Psidium guajava]